MLRTIRNCRLILGALFLGLVLQAHTSVRAGGITPCDTPFIFESAAANIVPIEYVATASEQRSGDTDRLERLQKTAHRLAWLLKLDSWHQQTYGSLGVVSHLFVDRQCPSDQVIGRLLVGGAAAPMPVSQILLVLEGRIFVEGDEIFLQSRLRGYRRNEKPIGELTDLLPYFVAEKFTTTLQNGTHKLDSQLPALDITFAPRALTYSEFDKIDEVFERASRVHEKPSTSSESQPLQFGSGRPQAFSVQILPKRGWIRIEDYFGGPSGYIAINREASEFLHRKLPELDFLNGLLGYLRLRQKIEGAESVKPPPDNASQHARASLLRFVERDATAGERNARALGRAMMGIMRADEPISTGSTNEKNWVAAREDFGKAAELAPYHSAYRNLLGIANASLCCAGILAAEIDDPARDFTDSISLDPENTRALLNLDAFLSLLGDLDDATVANLGLDVSRLDERHRIVKSVVSKLRDD